MQRVACRGASGTVASRHRGVNLTCPSVRLRAPLQPSFPFGTMSSRERTQEEK